MKYSVKVVKTESTRHPHVKGYATVILNDGIILKNVRRFKTGTPARINKRSIDFSKMEVQKGDDNIVPFSFEDEIKDLKQVDCYLTYTNEKTHRTFLNSKFNPINNDFRLALYNAIVEAYESGNIVTKYTESGEDMPLTITVKRFDDPENIVKASVAIIVDNNLVIKGIRYCDGKEKGMFLGMPSNYVPHRNKKFIEVCNPLTKEMDNTLKSLIGEAYETAGQPA